MFIGALLGTTPDLDVFINYGNAVANFTCHRGFSHSLLVLTPFSVVVWALLKKYFQPVREAPTAWFLAISLTLITHPLLDAHTAYGTQLLWPLSTAPVMWPTLYIIDPLYTLPLLAGLIAILVRPKSTMAIKTLAAGLVISCVYLSWTWMAKIYVGNQVLASLRNDTGIMSVFTTPTAFNSLLWRVVVLKRDQYLEGYYSLLDPGKDMDFTSHPANSALTGQAEDLWAVQRLRWFSQDFIKSAVIDDTLVISDLRMGFEGNYVFNHAVAKMADSGWDEIETKRLPSQFDIEDLSFVWERLTATNAN